LNLLDNFAYRYAKKKLAGSIAHNFKNGITSAPAFGAVTIKEIFNGRRRLYMKELKKNNENSGNA
jgi:hypothetical protein